MFDVALLRRRGNLPTAPERITCAPGSAASGSTRSGCCDGFGVLCCAAAEEAFDRGGDALGVVLAMALLLGAERRAELFAVRPRPERSHPLAVRPGRGQHLGAFRSLSG